MAKLGEAYVEVRADLDKFGKDLDRGLLALTNKFEKSLNADLGKRLGKDVGRGTRDSLVSEFNGIGKEIDKAIGGAGGTARSRGRRTGRALGDGIGDGLRDRRGFLETVFSGIITALDDGISSLPEEAKAAVGGALVALTPLIVGGVAALVNTTTIGLAAIVGSILAFQFEEVQARGQTFLDGLRVRFVNASRFFIEPLDRAFDRIDYRLALLDPTINRLFERASQFVEPVTEGTLDLIDNTIRGIERGFQEADFPGISESIKLGFDEIGVSLGNFFETLLANENTDEVLYDLLTSVSTLVDVLTVLLDVGLDVYGFLIDVKNTVDDLVAGFLELGDSIYDLARGVTGTERVKNAMQGIGDAIFGTDKIAKVLIKTTEEYNTVTDGTIKQTKAQQKAQKELLKELKAQDDLVNDLISTNVDYQAAVAATIEGFKDYKTNLDVTTEAGRGNITNIRNQINTLKEYVTAQVTSGKMTEEQARTYYNNQIARLKEEFRRRKGNIAQFEEIFGWLTQLAGFPDIPDKFGPFKLTLQDTATLLNAVVRAVTTLANAPKPAPPKRPAGYGPQAYADGGFINEPTFGMLGENYRREVVLPLTQPKRSLDLLSRSPLAGMLGGAPVVNVYLGDEQLNARQFAVATGVSRASARNLTQRPRSL